MRTRIFSVGILGSTLPAALGLATFAPRTIGGAAKACQLLKVQFPQLTSFPGKHKLSGKDNRIADEIFYRR